jgi:hypothetical protein
MPSCNPSPKTGACALAGWGRPQGRRRLRDPGVSESDGRANRAEVRQRAIFTDRVDHVPLTGSLPPAGSWLHPRTRRRNDMTVQELRFKLSGELGRRDLTTHVRRHGLAEWRARLEARATLATPQLVVRQPGNDRRPMMLFARGRRRDFATGLERRATAVALSTARRASLTASEVGNASASG